MSYLWAILASVFSGMAGAMGLGGGSVLLIYLTIISGVGQLKAQGINLMFFVPIAAIAVAVYCFKGKIEFKKILPFIVAGIPATMISGYFVNFINDDILRKIFGGLVLAYGIYQVFAREKQKSKG